VVHAQVVKIASGIVKNVTSTFAVDVNLDEKVEVLYVVRASPWESNPQR
jgi:hypothetical protein